MLNLNITLAEKNNMAGLEVLVSLDITKIELALCEKRVEYIQIRQIEYIQL